MLALTRKNGEQVILTATCDIPAGTVLSAIELLSTSGERAKIGFDSPPSVQILRGELLEKAKADEVTHDA